MQAENKLCFNKILQFLTWVCRITQFVWCTGHKVVVVNVRFYECSVCSVNLAEVFSGCKHLETSTTQTPWTPATRPTSTVHLHHSPTARRSLQHSNDVKSATSAFCLQHYMLSLRSHRLIIRKHAPVIWHYKNFPTTGIVNQLDPEEIKTQQKERDLVTSCPAK